MLRALFVIAGKGLSPARAKVLAAKLGAGASCWSATQRQKKKLKRGANAIVAHIEGLPAARRPTHLVFDEGLTAAALAGVLRVRGGDAVVAALVARLSALVPHLVTTRFVETRDAAASAWPSRAAATNGGAGGGGAGGAGAGGSAGSATKTKKRKRAAVYSDDDGSSGGDSGDSSDDGGGGVDRTGPRSGVVLRYRGPGGARRKAFIAHLACMRVHKAANPHNRLLCAVWKERLAFTRAMRCANNGMEAIENSARWRCREVAYAHVLAVLRSLPFDVTIPWLTRGNRRGRKALLSVRYMNSTTLDHMQAILNEATRAGRPVTGDDGGGGSCANGGSGANGGGNVFDIAFLGRVDKPRLGAWLATPRIAAARALTRVYGVGCALAHDLFVKCGIATPAQLRARLPGPVRGPVQGPVQAPVRAPEGSRSAGARSTRTRGRTSCSFASRRWSWARKGRGFRAAASASTTGRTRAARRRRTACWPARRAARFARTSARTP